METAVIIAVILAVLPYIAIVGTWTEISRMRKNIESDMEEISDILQGMKAIMTNMRFQQMQDYKSNNNSQGEWLGTEQQRL